MGGGGRLQFNEEQNECRILKKLWNKIRKFLFIYLGADFRRDGLLHTATAAFWGGSRTYAVGVVNHRATQKPRVVTAKRKAILFCLDVSHLLRPLHS